MLRLSISLYNIVDRIYIGHIPNANADALTGVGVAFPIGNAFFRQSGRRTGAQFSLQAAENNLFFRKGLTNGSALCIIEWYLGVAQFGSALEWGSRGREFNSPHSDHPAASPFLDLPLFPLGIFFNTVLPWRLFCFSRRAGEKPNLCNTGH